MASAGKGISDAVRNAVGEWMTDKTCDVLFQKLQVEGGTNGWNLNQFRNRVRTADNWVRIVRSRGVSGWRRTYYTKSFPSRGVTLEVNSNEADNLIEYVTVKANGKPIGGGKVKVPSMLGSQAGRKAGLVLSFTAFTDEELLVMQAEMENSGNQYLMEERLG